jgi:DNA-binding transcriptional MerR regulator
MQHFGTAEVSRLTRIPKGSIRAMVRARYVSPERGPRGSLRFTFQDLVLLRTARLLLAARISPRRVGDALRSVRAQLPADLPARGLSVGASDGRVVIHEAGEKRDAVSGQMLLSFDVRMKGDMIELIDVLSPADADPANSDCDRQFEAALSLEDTDVEAAVEAYRACVAKHSHHGARANLGRLLHLQGRISEAIALYRAVDTPDVDVLYNLAVALDDLGEAEQAIEAYNRVIALESDHADAHHNVARLWQCAGDQQRALRHWNAYRKLSRTAGV